MLSFVCKFYRRVRHPGESVSTFIAELRRLAKYCNFGTFLDRMLRDRIVCGIKCADIQVKLLAEQYLTLTVSSVLFIAQKQEVAMDVSGRNCFPGSESSSEIIITLGSFRQQERGFGSM